MIFNRYGSAFKVAIIYMIFSAAWILITDYMLLLSIDDTVSYQAYSTIKGLIFIITSSAIIYYLVNREVNIIKQAEMNITKLERFDRLTNLYNRHSFDEKLTQLAQEHKSVSVILSDINGLKLINEMYSSQEGDKTLISFSKLLKRVLPDNAFIARIGGDEYCSIIESCTKNDMVMWVETITHDISEKMQYDIPLTVAIGYAKTNDSAEIFNTLSIAEDRMMKNKLVLTESASNSVVQSLKTALFERSDETEQHANRMAEMAIKFGHKLNLSHNDINDLKLLAYLHDIGKIGIEDSILKKPAKLTKLEYNRMKQHPSIGFKIANNVEALESIAYYILTHHEWWDGNGYPKELYREDIPLISRILSIVDAWDAMTNDRVYRKAMSIDDAIKELKDNKGTQFEPKLVVVFLTLI
ncbi:MAG: diguanylate cyclase [Candidatus Izimaplasma sp.]|nr:diguanylate cyclase [Candidatus Izimaplasma bacterium]